MVAQFVLQFSSDGALFFLDAAVDELLDLAAVQAHDVIVMLTFVQLEYRCRPFEMMARDQARRLELGEHSIYRRQTDVFVGLQQMTIDVFRTHMPRFGAAQDFQDLEPRHRNLESRLSKIAGLHTTPRPVRLAMMRGPSTLSPSLPLGRQSSRRFHFEQ
jgi:hypothetical protein